MQRPMDRNPARAAADNLEATGHGRVANLEESFYGSWTSREARLFLKGYGV